jgi:phage terminase small subunit
VTSDGFLLGQHAGDLGMNDMLGTAADLRRNLTGLAKHMGLTVTERKTLLALMPSA